MVRSIGRLLDHGCLAKPLSLVEDGDLVAVVQHMTVRVRKVKGHATEADVQQGRVRAEDRFGNEEANAAADLGGRHQLERVMDVRRAFLNANFFAASSVQGWAETQY